MNEQTNITETTIHTKADKDSAAVETALRIDWEGMTVADLRAMAQQAMIVKLQASYRRNGIPDKATIKAADYKVGTRVAAKKDPVAAINKLSDADKAKVLEMLREQLGQQ